MAFVGEIITAFKTGQLVCGCLKDNCLCDAITKLNIIGLCIPVRKHINTIVNTLVCENVKFVDLDAQIDQHLSSNGEDVSGCVSLGPHDVNKLQFKAGLNVIDDLNNIYKMLSHQIGTVVYISHNYRLLKFSGCDSVNYFCPSDTLINSIDDENFNIKTYNEFKQDLILRKNSKINVYNTVDNLIDQVHIMFPGCNIKI